MGKSPAKWIKMVLFGKKSSRSHSSKARDASKAVDQKESAEGKGLPASTVDNPVISQTLAVNAARNDLMAQKGALPSLTTDGVVASSINQDAVIVASAGSGTPEKIREEQAAVKAQAAFRGYLARRAFRALRGIIRLQALIRGHLVRRQAVATLRCMQGIVKLQALVRGRRVRLSDIGSEAYEKFPRAKLLDTKQVCHFGVNISTQKARCSEASINAFVCKLFSSKLVALPLQMHYVQEEPNSVWNWLERWTCSRFWKPLAQPKKTSDPKSQTRNGGYAMETESGRSKRTVRRNFSANTDFGTTNNTAKHNFKKVVSSPTELVQEHPQSELEKVKRNLRKISNSMAQPSDQAEIEIEKPKHSARRTSSLVTDVSEIEVVDSAEKIKKNNVLLAADAKPEIENYSKLASVAKPHVEMTLEPSTESELHNETTLKAFPETKQNMNATTEPLEADMPVNASTGDNVATELQPVYGFAKDKNHILLNVEKTTNEEQSLHENQKSSKRRSSLSAKTEFNEDGLQNTPTLPSYMAATQSAKAKLRGLSSPRFSADGIEKNDFTRRHSLPSSTNGKLSTLSSQTQRQVQTNGRGGIRNDRSYGHGKPIQVEWRR